MSIFPFFFCAPIFFLSLLGNSHIDYVFGLQVEFSTSFFFFFFVDFGEKVKKWLHFGQLWAKSVNAVLHGLTSGLQFVVFYSLNDHFLEIHFFWFFQK
jgi:uncharacterized HAD superfamily protein